MLGCQLTNHFTYKMMISYSTVLVGTGLSVLFCLKGLSNEGGSVHIIIVVSLVNLVSWRSSVYYFMQAQPRS